MATLAEVRLRLSADYFNRNLHRRIEERGLVPAPAEEMAVWVDIEPNLEIVDTLRDLVETNGCRWSHRPNDEPRLPPLRPQFGFDNEKYAVMFKLMLP